MKRFDELTLEDMRLHPVWRFRSAEDDSVAMVEVDDRPQLSEQDTSTFVAVTVFRLADGSELTGLCSPSDPSGLDYLQPVIFTGAGHLRLWNEKRPGAVVDSACKHLGKRAASIFPLTFECAIPVDGARVLGTVGITEETSSVTLSVRLLRRE